MAPKEAAMAEKGKERHRKKRCTQKVPQGQNEVAIARRRKLRGDRSQIYGTGRQILYPPNRPELVRGPKALCPWASRHHRRRGDARRRYP